MTEPNKERMIPLHIADQAVAACNKEIAELRAQVAELKQQPDALTAYLYAAELAKADIKKLKAENTSLKAEVERLQNNCDYLDRELDREIDKTAMLCGQVERLRKAGDAMQKRLIFLHDRWDSDEPNIESDAWNAAKEGKQP